MLARTRALAAATAISLVVVAGCGASGDDGAKTAKSTTTAGNGSATTDAAQEPGDDNGIADLSADEILTKTKDALRSAGSVKVSGNVDEGSKPIAIDMSIGQDGSAGTLEINGSTVELIVRPDTVYMKGSEEFYRGLGTGGPAAAKLLAGKWLSVDADSEQAADFKQFADFDGFVDDFLDPGDVEKGEAGDIDGTAAIALEDTASDEPGQLWVATEGEPYPLQVNKKGSDTQKITLSEHGEAVDVTAPPSDEVISLEDLKSMDSGDSGN